MSIAPNPPTTIYPDSDGKPISDNTLQFEWIALLKWELDALFAKDPDVFVAGDLLWYPVHGRPDIRIGPDALVAFGRPKGYRGSYRQWEEGGVAPQVVFEVLSPGNRLGEMLRKQSFYDRFGVEEYYVYDPDTFEVGGMRRASDGVLAPIEPMDGWVSPRLGIRFDAPGDRELVIHRPDGVAFRNPLQIRQELERVELERQQMETERDRAEAERDRLAAKLRELGVDPDTL